MKRPLLVAASAATLFAAPTSAIAATVGEEPAGSGQIVYRAAAGESNALYSTGGFPLGFRELGAPVHVSDPCFQDGDVVRCPTLPEVFLRDRDDIAWFRAGFGEVRLHGGSGDDDLFASAPTDATAAGDGGADVIRVTAGLTGTADGGSGDDRISGGGATDGASVLNGGGDDDLIAHAGSSFATLDGGSGNDRIVAGDAFGGTRMTGGGGNDTLAFAVGAAAFGTWTIDAGSGNDVVSGHPGPDTVHGGGGVDWIDVNGGGADTVDCGTGVDIVWADVTDTVAADCELRLNAKAPRNPLVDAARTDAAALLARSYEFPS